MFKMADMSNNKEKDNRMKRNRSESVDESKSRKKFREPTTHRVERLSREQPDSQPVSAHELGEPRPCSEPDTPDLTMEPASSSAVNHATAKMKLILRGIKLSLNFFEVRLDKLTSVVEKQKSVSDIQKTELLFNEFFHGLENSMQTEKLCLQQQLKIILDNLINSTEVNSADNNCDSSEPDNSLDLDVGEIVDSNSASGQHEKCNEGSDLPETPAVSSQTPNSLQNILDVNNPSISSDRTILMDEPKDNEPNRNSSVPVINVKSVPDINSVENVLSAMFQTDVETQMNSPIPAQPNSPSENLDPNEKSETTLSSPLGAEESNRVIEKHRNEKDQTSETVISCLNSSSQSENWNSDDDRKPEAGDFDLTSKSVTKNSKTARTEITGDIIEISDDSSEETEGSVKSTTQSPHISKSRNNVAASSKDEDIIEILDDSSDETDTIITPIRSPQHSLKSSNDAAERPEVISESTPNNSMVSPKSFCNFPTPKINHYQSDNAKNDLLASSSSSSDEVTCPTDSKSDSDATVKLPVSKNKKLRKKRKKVDSVKNRKDDADSSAEVERLLNLKNLKKQRRSTKSSDGSHQSVASSDGDNERRKKTKKSAAKQDEIDIFSSNDPQSELDEPDFQRLDVIPPNCNPDDIYKNTLVSDSIDSSEDESPPSPKVKKARKTREKEVTKTYKTKKKRKYDRLLHENFQLSESDSDMNQENKSKKKKEELLQPSSNSSAKEKNSNSAVNQTNQEETEPIDILSSDPEDVEPSEVNTEDNRVVVSDREMPVLPVIEQKSIKSGRKNIRCIAESTLEYRQAAEVEEKRQKRLCEKETLLSQTFPETDIEEFILDVHPATKRALVTVHPALKKVLAEHQIEGVKFVWNRCFESVDQVRNTEGSGCILAHCMGLGKSLQVITLIHTIINHPKLDLRTILIICPLSVILNWSDEFKKWLKVTESSSQKVEVFSLSGCYNNDLKLSRLRNWQKKGGVMLMGYKAFCTLVLPSTIPETSRDVYDGFRNCLVDRGPDIVVFDEGHLLKNASTNTNKAANLVRTKRRIILTGTPMQNNLMEYYHMVNFIQPNYLGNKHEFSNRFFGPINNGQFEDSTPADVRLQRFRSHVLSQKLDKLVHRCDSHIMKNQLPERYEFILKLRMSKLQIDLYTKFLDSLKNNADETRETATLMKCDKVLASIVNHPILVNTNDPSPEKKELRAEADLRKRLEEHPHLEDVDLSSKTVLFFQILEKCAEIGDKLLVFSECLKTLNLLESFLGKASGGKTGSWISGKDYFRLDGKTKPSLRQQYCQIFNSNDKKARLFLLSIKAGSLGLNLTGANRAIIFEVSWNPSVDAQSAFRIYRFGQTKPCYIYRFVTKGTMEEKKYHRQVNKLSTSSRVVDKRQVGRHFQEKYLQKLFEYELGCDQSPSQSTHKLVEDKVLSDLLPNSNCINCVEEHDMLLMNILDEELTMEDQEKAMEDYEREEKAGDTSALNTNALRRRPSNSEGVVNLPFHLNAVCPPPPTMPPFLRNMIEQLEASSNEKFYQLLPTTSYAQINPIKSNIPTSVNFEPLQEFSPISKLPPISKPTPMSEPAPPLPLYQPTSPPTPPASPIISSNQSEDLVEARQVDVKDAVKEKQTSSCQSEKSTTDIRKNTGINGRLNHHKESLASSSMKKHEHKKKQKDNKDERRPEKSSKSRNSKTTPAAESIISKQNGGKSSDPKNPEDNIFQNSQKLTAICEHATTETGEKLHLDSVMNLTPGSQNPQTTSNPTVGKPPIILNRLGVELDANGQLVIASSRNTEKQAGRSSLKERLEKLLNNNLTVGKPPVIRSCPGVETDTNDDPIIASSQDTEKQAQPCGKQLEQPSRNDPIVGNPPHTTVPVTEKPEATSNGPIGGYIQDLMTFVAARTTKMPP